MKTDEDKGKYISGASEIEDSTNNAMAMLGVGYDDQPTVIVEAPRTITARKNGRMVDVEEPAWVKFSTNFKKELKTIDEYSLKVFLFIGLSVDWKTGKTYPGLRKIAEETGMDKDTVAKAVNNLEKIGFLTIQKRDGNSNIYKPVRYILTGTVPQEGTVPSDGKEELSPQNNELSDAQEGNLHNKKNKNKLDIPEIVKSANKSMDKILEYAGVGEEIAYSTHFFEEALGFGSLPWGSNHTWKKFQRWVAGFSNDLGIFKEYATWRRGEGQYKGAMTNTSIRRDPQIFMDTGWPNYLAYTSMSKKPATLQNVRTL